MKKTKIWRAIDNSSSNSPTRKLMLGGLTLAMLGMTNSVQAQSSSSVQPGEEIVVTGIRQSLANALAEKRNSDNLIEVIQAEDIGKLPDQNLAEVLENITGIQITRTAGVGTNVQIRGTDANRIEINGTSTTGSGAGRQGIDFEDVNASIIASVEVTKSPEAKTTEGSVGGTVNLKTIRPLDLKDTLGSLRIQGEDSSLSEESIQPRISGAWGDNWDTDSGRFGFVISGSYIEQEAVSFRPRADRDNLANISGLGPLPEGVPEEFLGIQFLVQEQENDDFETINVASTFEWAPNENSKFFVDAIINEQERSRDQYRLQASGVSTFINSTIPTEFGEANFGPNGGVIPTAEVGVIEPGPTDDNPNLRFTSETNSRVTDTEIYRIGGEWGDDRWTVKAEFSTSKSETETPSLNTTLNFINPNAPLIAGVEIPDPDDPTDTITVRVPIDRNGVALADLDLDTLLADAVASVPGGILAESIIFNDNATPFAFDLTNQSLSSGINDGSPIAPSAAELLDPSNVVLDQVDQSADSTENNEDVFRLDFSYAFGDTGIKSVDFGYRYNDTSSRFEDIDGRIGGFSNLADSPSGDLFSDILVEGPDNFGDADGRDLFIRNFLLVDPDTSFSNPEAVLASLEAALAAHGNPDVLELESELDSFYEIEETTNALYAQLNFEYGIFRGNIGARYVDTDVDSISFSPIVGANGVRALQTQSSSYDEFLPRLNVIAQPTDNLIFRLGYGSDIRRPDFDQLSAGFSFETSENGDVQFGNPGLSPETVDSFDIAAEWYFAPSSVLSIGYFRKERDDIVRQSFDGALLVNDPTLPGGLARETDPTCPGGGVFNPIAQPNVLGDPNTLGLCVDSSSFLNDGGSTTQDGIEIAFQYDLSSFEDSIGWASGFGLQANATFQDFSGDSVIDETSGRGLSVLGEQSIPQGLLDFSETAYNLTVFYEKYGLSARARYTWRDDFRTQDFGGGANTSGSSTFSFPVVTEARGQLNLSVNYDVTDQFNVGVEVVNATEEEIVQRCVTESGPICFVGFPDRRITFGGSYRF